jgi:hypothetical protein
MLKFQNQLKESKENKENKENKDNQDKTNNIRNQGNQDKITDNIKVTKTVMVPNVEETKELQNLNKRL